jgi:hypothetical protein
VPDVLAFTSDIDHDQAVLLIQGTLARAAVYAPCILDAAFTGTAAAKDIVLAGVLRRHQTAGGVVTTSTIGSTSITVDNRALIAGVFLASEIEELQRLCRVFSDSIGLVQPAYFFQDAPKWPDPIPTWISPSVT